MSCHLCSRELEFSEIAGYNPNLPVDSEDRTNFTFHNGMAVPLCDDCYWADDERETIENEGQEDQEEEEEEQEEEDYSTIYCIECGNPIEGISLDDFSDDDEAAEASTNYVCADCAEDDRNPSTPPTRELNESPSDEEAPPPLQQPSYRP